MNFKNKKSSTLVLSDKIADALTVKPRADIEDDQVFGTKPKTVSRADLSSSSSEDEAAISDFRKRNINLLSDVSKKYDGQVVSRKELAGSEDGSYEESDSEDESNLLTAKDLLLDDNEESADEAGYEIKENGTKLQPQNSIPKSLQFESKSDVLSLIQKTRKQIQGSDSEDLSSIEGENDDSDVNEFQEQMQESSKPTNKEKNQSSSQIKQKRESDSEDLSADEGESDDYDITQFTKQIQLSKESFNIAPKKMLQSIAKSKLKSDSNELPLDEEESDDLYHIQFKKQIQGSDVDSEDNEENSDEDEGSDDNNENEGEGYDISQMDEPMKEEFEHVKKQNVSEEVKKGTSVRNQLLLWEGLLEIRIHLQRCMNTANQLPLPDTYQELKENNDFTEECNATKANIATVMDK